MAIGQRPGFVPAILTLILLLSQASNAAADDTEILRRRLEAEQHDALLVAGQPMLAHRAIGRFYEARGFRPAWFDDGQPRTRRVRQMLAAIGGAEDQGLTAAPYHRAYITRHAAESSALSAQGRVDLELALTDAFLMLGMHFLAGRLDPETIEPTWTAARRTMDMAAHLERALASGDIQATLRSLLPGQPEYAQLAATLAELRRTAARGGWTLIAQGDPIRPAMEDSRIPSLKRRLGVESEAAWITTPTMYGPELEAAIRTFQATHGLEVDGIIGPATVAELNVPVERRIEQVIVNLERWRWLPQELGLRHVRVNIAGFTVSGVRDGEVELRKRAIVGRDYRRTPIFSDMITYVVLNPRWIVPPELAARDLLPRLRKDPGYLQRQNFTVYEGWAADGREIAPEAIDWNAVTPPLIYRLVQQPGPANALGQVKIMFPNSFNVYLHDTPDRSLFSRTRRTFSAGCVRVEDPLALTAWLLAPSGPTRREIDAAVAQGDERTIGLPEPVPIHFLYWTAWTNAEGEVIFAEDVYRRDARVLKALQASPPVEP